MPNFKILWKMLWIFLHHTLGWKEGQRELWESSCSVFVTTQQNGKVKDIYFKKNNVEMFSQRPHDNYLHLIKMGPSGGGGRRTGSFQSSYFPYP